MPVASSMSAVDDHRLAEAFAAGAKLRAEQLVHGLAFGWVANGRGPHDDQLAPVRPRRCAASWRRRALRCRPGSAPASALRRSARRTRGDAVDALEIDQPRRCRLRPSPRRRSRRCSSLGPSIVGRRQDHRARAAGRGRRGRRVAARASRGRPRARKRGRVSGEGARNSRIADTGKARARATGAPGEGESARLRRSSSSGKIVATRPLGAGQGQASQKDHELVTGRSVRTSTPSPRRRHHPSRTRRHQATDATSAARRTGCQHLRAMADR